MSDNAIETERLGPIAWIWLNRPDVHNAFDPVLIQQLTTAYENLGQHAETRAIVLAARGKSFSAGAQIQWMRTQGAASKEQNLDDARVLAKLFQTISECSKPTVARVQGAAIGGGVGLVCACDIAVASADAVFATSEVRLGLIPATIGPYVLRAIGQRQARRLFQTGERIDAAAAERIGLIHQAVAPQQLDDYVRGVTESLIAGAPLAQRAARELIDAISNRTIDAELIEYTAQQIAERRAHDEAREGLSAFLEKRQPSWARQI